MWAWGGCCNIRRLPLGVGNTRGFGAFFIRALELSVFTLLLDLLWGYFFYLTLKGLVLKYYQTN